MEYKNFNEEKKQWLENLPEKSVPNSVHKVYALSNEDTRNKIFFGTRRTGRTHMLILDAIYEAIHNSNIRIGFVGTIGMREYSMDMARKVLEDIGIENNLIQGFHRNPHRIIFRNGTSIVFFRGNEDFIGTRINRLYFDNVDYIKDDVFENAIMCTVWNQNSNIISAALPMSMQTEKMQSRAQMLLGGN